MSEWKRVELLVGFNADVGWTEDFPSGIVRFDKPARYIAGRIVRCARCAYAVRHGFRLACSEHLIEVAPQFFCASGTDRADDAPSMHDAAIARLVVFGYDPRISRLSELRESWKGSARDEEG